MASLLTREDIRDVYIKLYHRGLNFLLSKFSFNKNKRTKSSFNDDKLETANWWIIPAVRRRWNELVTGNPDMSYEEYLSSYLSLEKKPLKMLSMGSGVCTHELLLAELNPHWSITCLDFSDALITVAKQKAQEKKLNNISFFCEDLYQYAFPDNHYDIIFFHSSLHHIDSISAFMYSHIYSKLKRGGKLIINEYVGPDRLQYPTSQIRAINEGLTLIEEEYKEIYKTRLKKKTYYGSGLWRMKIADPSECIDSAAILPSVYRYFNIDVERPYGGNILMPALKDIAHHFVAEDTRSMESLQRIMDYEDQYLLDHSSDFVFGIYTKKQPEIQNPIVL